MQNYLNSVQGTVAFGNGTSMAACNGASKPADSGGWACEYNGVSCPPTNVPSVGSAAWKAACEGLGGGGKCKPVLPSEDSARANALWDACIEAVHVDQAGSKCTGVPTTTAGNVAVQKLISADCSAYDPLNPGSGSNAACAPCMGGLEAHAVSCNLVNEAVGVTGIPFVCVPREPPADADCSAGRDVPPTDPTSAGFWAWNTMPGEGDSSSNGCVCELPFKVDGISCSFKETQVASAKCNIHTDKAGGFCTPGGCVPETSRDHVTAPSCPDGRSGFVTSVKEETCACPSNLEWWKSEVSETIALERCVRARGNTNATVSSATALVYGLNTDGGMESHGFQQKYAELWRCD